VATEHQETSSPIHHSEKSGSLGAVIVGIVGGLLLFGGIALWYFTRVDPIARQRAAEAKEAAEAKAVAGVKEAIAAKEAAARREGVIVLEKDILDIVPLSEMHVKIVNGVAESTETPKESGLTAKVDGKTLTIHAGKEAKSGAHEIKVKGAKGEQTILKVNVKK
jgi:hypothetical protein